MKQLAAAATLAFAALTAGAQTTSYSQVTHIHTALGHLTVLELGEPIKTFAVANPDSFAVEQHGDKVFLKPLRKGESTNLFIWTDTRETSYELDPAGEVTAMDVLIRSVPPASSRPTIAAAASAAPASPVAAPATPAAGTAASPAASVSIPAPAPVPSSSEAAASPIPVLADSESISRDDKKVPNGTVSVTLQEVYHTKYTTYVRYTIVNRSEQAFHASAPAVSMVTLEGSTVSLAGLRNHQLRPSTTEGLKVSLNAPMPVVGSTDLPHDLAPGESGSGVVGFRGSDVGDPRLFVLRFSDSAQQPVNATAVL